MLRRRLSTRGLCQSALTMLRCPTASAWDRGLWKDIIKDPVLLSLCTAKHAGLVALQLFATWICPKTRPTKAAEGQVATVWCGESACRLPRRPCTHAAKETHACTPVI